MVNSQNGYAVLDKKADNKEYKVPGSTTVLPLRPDAAGELLVLFAANFHKEVESLNKTDCHGYNRRKISGSDEWSNHASGTAIDLNATKHPQGKSGSYTKEQNAKIEELLKKYEGTIKAGKNYREVKDEMHFEIDKPLADVKKVLAKLKKADEPKVKNRGKISFAAAIRAGNGGKQLATTKAIQRALVEEGFGDFPATGFYGPQTREAYAKHQKKLGFKGADADGRPGNKSLLALGFKDRG